MKYIKLFENFDRYEFGEHDIDELDDMKSSAKIFTDDERILFSNMIIETKLNVSDFGLYNGQWDSNEFNYLAFIMQPSNNGVCVYNLGDYCYAVSYVNHSTRRYLYVVDDWCEIIPTIKMIEENDRDYCKSLNESFDRYDFGEHTPLSYSEMRKLAGNFTNDEYFQIEEILNENGLQHDEDYIIENDKEIQVITVPDAIDVHNIIEIYNLGDYCYGVYRYCDNIDESPNCKLVVVDDIDSIISVVLKFLNSNQVNEDIDRYEYGKFKKTNLLWSLDEFRKIAIPCHEEYDILFNLYGKMNDVYINYFVDKILFGYMKITHKRGSVSTSRCNYHIYSLGDYCYALVDTVLDEYYILDEFDSVIQKIKELCGI